MASTRDDKQRTNLGLAIAGAAAVAGAGAAFLFARRNAGDDEERFHSDAPHWTLKDADDQAERPIVGKTVTVDRPRDELYAIWRDFTRFPQFMDNVRSVERLDATRSRWSIEAPGGGTVELVTRITEEREGERIYWQSEPESDIETKGMALFQDAPAGRGTYVSLVMSYDPPGGVVGRGLAKLLQREPAVQARRDLRRFKQLMETGEVTTNASPSGRKSESPTEPRI